LFCADFSCKTKGNLLHTFSNPVVFFFFTFKLMHRTAMLGTPPFACLLQMEQGTADNLSDSLWPLQKTR